MYSKEHRDRIIFIISDLGSGGAQRVIVTLSNYWVDMGFHVSILTLENKNSFYELDQRIFLEQNKNQRVDILGASLLKKILSNFKKIQNIRDVYGKYPNGIFISFIDRTNILSLIANIGLGRRLVVSERGNLSTTFLPFTWKFLRRMLYGKAYLQIAQTKGVINEYVKFGIPTKNVATISNPLSLRDSPLNNTPKENMLLAVGRLHVDKGFEDLIVAYRQSGVTWPLYILGEGDERARLEKLISEFCLSNAVFLLGNIGDIANFYKRASIFILSSKTEGMPNVLLEAMEFGCACISSNCAYGPSEIIDDKVDGILYDVGNTLSLSKAIKELVDSKETITRLASNAKKKASFYSIESVSNKWLDAII